MYNMKSEWAHCTSSSCLGYKYLEYKKNLGGEKAGTNKFDCMIRELLFWCIKHKQKIKDRNDDKF